MKDLETIILANLFIHEKFQENGYELKVLKTPGEHKIVLLHHHDGLTQQLQMVPKREVMSVISDLLYLLREV